MSLKKRIFFLAIVIYSVFGVFQMGKGGGPCNAGLVIIVLTPILVILAMSELLVLYKSKASSGGKYWFYFMLSISCTVFWGWLTVAFVGDKLTDDLIYMCPFLIMNITITVTHLVNHKRYNKVLI